MLPTYAEKRLSQAGHSTFMLQEHTGGRVYQRPQEVKSYSK